jgi:transcriptional regulator with XRE-family HTH domain
MTQISDNLTARREALGLSVTQIHAALNERGIDVAFSTVAGWFNGNRGVRNMDHLKALCAVLETDLNSLTGEEIEVAEGPIEATIAREIRHLPQEQKEAVLVLVRTMKKSQ